MADLLTNSGNHQAVIDENRKKEWLRNFIGTIEQEHQCVEVPPYDDSRDTAVLIEAVANHICQQCFANDTVCLFIDGGDDASEDGWFEFERHILEPFAREPQMQFIIALRDEQRVRAVPLIWSETPLSLGTLSDTEKGHLQLSKLIETYGVSLNIDNITEQFAPYNFQHAGLNTFIFYTLANNQLGLPLSELLLVQSSLEAIQYNPPLDPSLPTLLSQVAELDSPWSMEELSRLRNCSRTDAWDQIGTMQEYFLIKNAEDNTNRYEIIEGLREFVQAVKSI